MHECLIFCMQHSACCTFCAGTLKRHAAAQPVKRLQRRYSDVRRCSSQIDRYTIKRI